MTTMAPDGAGTQVDGPACGCCGRVLPPGRLTELGNTPGVFICGSCAVWAARRATRVPVVRLDPRLAVRWLRGSVPTRRGLVGTAAPILPSADLDRTAAYYEALGLRVASRDEGYLVLNAGPAELHFTTGEDLAAPAQAFVHVADAGRLWKQLKSAGVAGIGPVEDQPHGLREFVVTDPDGNRIRVGSPTLEA
jgi:catechol 2,3-dioxygenase-like lactoylglutathione lyase family enzyme